MERPDPQDGLPVVEPRPFDPLPSVPPVTLHSSFLSRIPPSPVHHPGDRLKALLRRLALAEALLHDGVPAEGFHFVLGAVESFTVHGRADLGSASLDLHRLFFPMLGESRSKKTQAAMKRNEFVPPPPMHPFFATAFEYVVVDDSEGSRRALARFHTADHGIGLSRCFLAGALPTPPGAAYGYGSSLAGITHKDGRAKALGGFLGVLAHHVLRGASAVAALRATVLHGMANSGSTFASICEAAGMGEHDSTSIRDIEYPSCSEVARIIGRAAVGKPVIGLYGPQAAVSVNPLLALLGGADSIPGSLAARIDAAVDAAVAAGIVEG